MENEFIELLTSKGVVGVLAAFILFLLVLLKMLFTRYEVVSKDRNELAKDVISVILKYEIKTETDIKDNEEVKRKLDKLQDAINGINR